MKTLETKAVGVLISTSSSGSSVTGLDGSSIDCRLGLGAASTDLKEGLPRPGRLILGTAPGGGPPL